MLLDFTCSCVLERKTRLHLLVSQALTDDRPERITSDFQRTDSSVNAYAEESENQLDSNSSSDIKSENEINDALYFTYDLNNNVNKSLSEKRYEDGSEVFHQRSPLHADTPECLQPSKSQTDKHNTIV
jgi:hypothetical protein